MDMTRILRTSPIHSTSLEMSSLKNEVECMGLIKNRIGKARSQFLGQSGTLPYCQLRPKSSFPTSWSYLCSFICETWKITEGDKQKLNIFQRGSLRKIKRIRWPYKISNTNLLKKNWSVKDERHCVFKKVVMDQTCIKDM